ncbi:hypothetical protein acsn021_28950 [Anaerocolumna cellulosilytica]|uniref:Uncharacterized protein n=1 Tax=Anaerocolumna cellulosilytica TaxID=433286 RepID=A0A6S6QZW1_9FIRM|nr:hypothetical protein [Anaerocolumna cellulosilytica]MBB5197113.1 hypothetical protein [Anaerocolumna cellulosilytica]BCJ95326.1 hypothetical protein acsn021_28950 [Anaerocolumna cellulosilytica]
MHKMKSEKMITPEDKIELIKIYEKYIALSEDIKPIAIGGAEMLVLLEQSKKL